MVNFITASSWMPLVGIDFETYSDVDIRSHGMYRYMESENFQPLMVSLNFSDGRVVSKDLYNLSRGEGAAMLQRLIRDSVLTAFNAPFELGILQWYGINTYEMRVVDAATEARAFGASGNLNGAARQILGMSKLEEGSNLIMKFCVPGKYQEAAGSLAFDPAIVTDNPDDWATFTEYCEKDALLGLQISASLAEKRFSKLTKESYFETIAYEMNSRGWTVDLDIVKEMQERYLSNVEELERQWRHRSGAHDLNFASPLQIQRWCKERGISSSSFDSKTTEKLINKIYAKLSDPNAKISDEKRKGYREVLEMLEVKAEIGGSSLKKLKTILDQTSVDGQLRGQYIHIGAGQTFRTSGRGVQMQNLKRLFALMHMENLYERDEDGDIVHQWSNEQLAENLRQVFTASDPNGFLIVGDLASIESRGLAWFAGEEWKLEAYAKGQDIYKLQAMKSYPGLAYEAVTKPQRTFGKVGELSCGYGAGAGAVKSFAEGMGVELTTNEAQDVVKAWREANPNIVKFWAKLDEMLQEFHSTRGASLELKDGFKLCFKSEVPPDSLLKLMPGAKTLVIELQHDSSVIMRRRFHGLHRRQRGFGYFKPSKNKTGDPWVNKYFDPKSKQTIFYNVYGGKLSGILTQSMCRELFMYQLQLLDKRIKAMFDSSGKYYGQERNVYLVGQFHDEIVLDWKPGAMPLHGATSLLYEAQRTQFMWKSLPLNAEVNHDYRYTK